MPDATPEPPAGRSFEDMLADPGEQFDPRSELLASIAAYADAPSDTPSAAPGQSATPPRPLTAPLGDVRQRHAEVKRERDDARSAFARLAAHFTQGKQSGWTARVSGTVLRRLCVAAMCEPPAGSDVPDEASELADRVDRLEDEATTWHDLARDRRDLIGEILHEAADYLPGPLMAQYRERAGLDAP